MHQLSRRAAALVAAALLAAVPLASGTLGAQAPARRPTTDASVGATGGPSGALPAALRSAASARFADSVLQRMTLEDKVGQLVQSPGEGSQTGPRATQASVTALRAGHVGSFLGIFGSRTTRELQRIAVEESPRHIPLLFALDVIHGFRTIFPMPIAEAASFDPDNAERAARTAAIEASANGLHWTFAPMVDIARDGRWGRIIEGSGEDPYLGSLLAAARVRGFQGGDPAGATTILATAKHFAAYGASEGGRDYNSAEVSERTLWETYMPPFEAAARAGAATFMAGFSEIGGTPPHASRWLLTDVLRGQWGFPGLVVSDWAGIEELIPHGVAATRGEAGVVALRAGVDVDMSDNVWADSLVALVRAGRVSEAQVDTAVRRVLIVKHALGLFAAPYRYSDAAREARLTRTAAQTAQAREAAREAIVLLRNEGGTLPLGRSIRSLLVVGALADDRQSALGSWAADGRREDAVTVLAGIRAAAQSRGITVRWVKGVEVDTANDAGIAEAARAAADADAVVVVLGERADMTAEAQSRASIELPGSQLQLAQAVVRAARAGGETTPVVAVLMNGRPMAAPWLADSMPAIVESWFLGIQHGNAVADVLFGDYNPGGRMPITVPRATGQIPIYYDHKNTGRPPDDSTSWTEPYKSNYRDMRWTPLYPFGWGLSYTTFAYRNLRVSSPTLRAGDSLTVTVDVTNTGARAGDDVVQLYVRDDAASVSRPVRQLRGFQRLTLRPGETRTARFTLGAEAMALYDLGMRRVVEPGTFTLWAGAHSSDSRLSSRFTVTGDTLVLRQAPPRFR